MQADAAMSRHQPGEQEKAVRNGKFSQPDDPDISIRLVRLGDIKFDGYQRGTRRTSQSVHDHYNAHLYQPLELSERKNGDLYGIDGKQRHAGRIKLDGPDTMVLARVHQGLDVAAEVRLFEQMNTQRVRVSAFDILSAQRYAGEPDAVEIFGIVEGLGLTISDKNGPSRVGSVATLRSIYGKTEGPLLLGLTLGILKGAWGNDQHTFHAIPVLAVSRLLAQARSAELELWSKEKAQNEFAAFLGQGFKATEQVVGQEVKWGNKLFAWKAAKAWNKKHPRAAYLRFSNEFIGSLGMPDPE